MEGKKVASLKNLHGIQAVVTSVFKCDKRNLFIKETLNVCCDK